MSGLSPLGFIALGFLLAVGGFVVLFLMVIQVIEAGFLLNFAGYGASFLGLLMGIIGLSQYTTDGHGRF